MLFTKDILKKIVQYRNSNCLIYGEDLSAFNILQLEPEIYNSIEYKQKNDIYYIDTKLNKKQNIIEFIDTLSSSFNYYGDNIEKKVIILINLQSMNTIFIQKIKALSEKKLETSCFLIHYSNYSDIHSTIKNRFLIMNVKNIEGFNNIDDTIIITYNKIVKLLKKPMTQKTIEEIREICYMYYMNHETSVDLQRYIIRRLNDYLVLPNDIRYKIVMDIAEINHKYRFSYRKPIFLETIIYCLFKHLEHYNINHELL